MEPILSICYAAFGARDFLFADNVLELTRIPGVEVLIVWQRPETESWKRLESGGAKVILSQKIGTSNSRNLAIESAAGTYLWSLDDDTRVPLDAVQRLIGILEKKPAAEAFTIRIGCLEDESRLYKDYDRWIPNQRLGTLRSSMIEMLMNRAFIIEHAVRLPLDMGLGTDQPCGDESMFLMQILDAGGRLQHLPYVSVYHTCLPDGRLGITIGNFIARGRVLKVLGGPWAALAGLFWTMRAAPGIPRLDIIRAMWRGWKQEGENIRAAKGA